jgi:hypothetical protein
MRRLRIELQAALGSRWSVALVGLGLPWLTMGGEAVFLALTHRCCTRPAFLPISMLFAMSAYIVTLGLGATVPLMLTDLQGLRVPGRLSAHAGRALAALLLVTAVLPAVALAYAQRSMDPVLIIVGGTLNGLFLVRLPRWLSTALVVLAFVLILACTKFGLLAGALAMWLEPQVAEWLSFAALAGLVVWLWRPVLAGDPRALESAARHAAGWGFARDLRFGQQPLSGWSNRWFPSLPQGSAPPQPVHIARLCFGPLYLPGTRAALRVVAQAALPLAVLVAQFWFLGWHRAWRFGVSLCLLVLWTAYGLEVQRALSRVNGELAELALLPGLGNRGTQLRVLWRASLATPLTIAAVMSALVLLAASAEDPTLPGSLGTLAWLGSTTALGIAFMASALARRPGMWVDWAALAALAVTLVLWVLREGDRGGYLPAAWAALPLIACVILIVNARRLGSLPHPFIARM